MMNFNSLNIIFKVTFLTDWSFSGKRTYAPGLLQTPPGKGKGVLFFNNILLFKLEQKAPRKPTESIPR